MSKIIEKKSFTLEFLKKSILKVMLRGYASTLAISISVTMSLTKVHLKIN